MKYYFAVDESSLPPLGDTIFKKERKKLSVALEAQFGLQMFEDRKHQFSEFFSDDEQDVDIYLSALLTTLDQVAAAREDKDYDKQGIMFRYGFHCSVCYHIQNICLYRRTCISVNDSKFSESGGASQRKKVPAMMSYPTTRFQGRPSSFPSSLQIRATVSSKG